MRSVWILTTLSSQFSIMQSRRIPHSHPLKTSELISTRTALTELTTQTPPSVPGEEVADQHPLPTDCQEYLEADETWIASLPLQTKVLEGVSSAHKVVDQETQAHTFFHTIDPCAPLCLGSDFSSTHIVPVMIPTHFSHLSSINPQPQLAVHYPSCIPNVSSE